MRIASSAVTMAASSNLTVSSSKQTNLQYWVGERSNGVRQALGDQADTAKLSALAKKLSQSAAKPETAVQNCETDWAVELDVQLTDRDMQKIKLIEEFMYKLTGKRFKFMLVSKLKLKSAGGEGAHPPDAAAQAPQRAGYGLIYDSVERHSEQQTMAFQAAGKVTTQDGREIDFTVALNMSREFHSHSEIHIRAGDAQIDPLVINLGGGGPQFAQRDFSFDLDCDGEADQIARLLSGSGYLALDKNEDGKINDGSELFGPTLGNGFAELAAYDTDGNNWIDENDPIYDRLRIWMADENGDMQLFALGQQGVGALYLGNVASLFDVRDGQNNSLGTVQSTGVYLRENGVAGTLQHIDLTV